jgi:ParB family transcriptional regulator, chromosome partitioning protein
MNGALYDTMSDVKWVGTEMLIPSRFSQSVYGKADVEIERDGLFESIRARGILVPLVITKHKTTENWEVISGHRRLACAKVLGLTEAPCVVRVLRSVAARKLAVLDYNRQRQKTFSQRMREADQLEKLYQFAADQRRRSNLKQFSEARPDRRNSDTRTGRTDQRIAQTIGLGGKDLYRQARALWLAGNNQEPRALAAIAAIDAGMKTIHAAYKDLRRQNRFTAGFRPTPYDVWSFKVDRAFGVPHPGSIPPAIVAHLLHYFTAPGAKVVDPMAGGGATLDVCQAMGRLCLAYDLTPIRPDIRKNDVRSGLPQEAYGSDLIFLDPPYHTMLAAAYSSLGVEPLSLTGWVAFLNQIAKTAQQAVRPGGYVALLLANQSEKDLPLGHGYLDHAFLGYQALLAVGLLPQRRISCPMDGAYRPQQVRRAREDGRLLGQVRDLLIFRKLPVDPVTVVRENIS